MVKNINSKKTNLLLKCSKEHFVNYFIHTENTLLSNKSEIFVKNNELSKLLNCKYKYTTKYL